MPAVTFLVADIRQISGGSNVILECALALHRAGFDVTLASEHPIHEVPARPWHPALRELRLRHYGQVAGPSDFLFATWWPTVFDLCRWDARVYGSFNQSLESRFHDDPHSKRLNHATYFLPLCYVTEAEWLARMIAAVQPSAEVICLGLGLGKALFPPVAVVPEARAPLRVLVEGTYAMPLKGVAETLALLDEARLPVQVGWLTPDAGGVRPQVGGVPVRVHERVPIAGVAEVLREYDVMIKLSTVEGVFGPPLEMFSQGGTVITNTVSGAEQYVVHGHNALVAPPADRGQVARYLQVLCERPEVLRRLRENALATARERPDKREMGAALAGALQRLLARGYENRGLRAQLCALSLLRDHWQAEADLVGAAAAVHPTTHRIEVGAAELRLLRALRRVYHSAPALRARRALRGLRGAS